MLETKGAEILEIQERMRENLDIAASQLDQNTRRQVIVIVIAFVIA